MTQIVCLFTYIGSTLLWTILNPFGLWQTFAQAGGQIVAVARRLRQPALEKETAVSFSLPFAGTWSVFNGGVEKQNSHSWSLVAQRYAYDFVMTGEDGQSHAGRGETPQDYHCFGQPILAAAAGEVVVVRDDIDDYGRAGSCWIDWRTRDMRGNYVTIKHADGVYSLSAHLQRGSVAVAVGDRVQRGQQIGRCGHSGHSTEPHLHFQVQDHPSFFLAVGLPIRFQHFVQQPVAAGETLEAETAVAVGYLTKGHLVRATETAGAQSAPLANEKVTGTDLLISIATLLLGMAGIYVVILEIIGLIASLLLPLL